MKNLEKQILENLFDSLDRLFDHQCLVYDVHDLMFVSDIALKGLGSAIDLAQYLDKLESIVNEEMPIEKKREAALIVTDDFRSLLNDLLPIE